MEIERVAGQQPYMGEQMPIRWLRFEQQLTQQADSGTSCATLSQVLNNCTTLGQVLWHCATHGGADANPVASL